MNKSFIPEIFDFLLSYCESSIKSSYCANGLVYNSIVKDYYIRETAFCSFVFATKWKISGDKFYYKLSTDCLDAILDTTGPDLSLGLEEPYWHPRKSYRKKGSVPSTIILLHCVEMTCNILQRTNIFDVNSISKFVETCSFGNGSFSHDSFLNETKSKNIPCVLNTTSMILSALDCDIKKEETFNFLKFSQRSDGLWPYVSSGRFQHLIYPFLCSFPDKFKRFYNKLLRDNSIFFGDYLHHVVTLYYILSAKINHDDINVLNVLKKAFGFILKHTEICNKYHRLDFDWEPNINSYRHCNMKDSSTYFYLLSCYNIVKQKKINLDLDCDFYINGLSSYIFQSLLIDNQIKAYDCTDKECHYILPRPAESSFDKSFFVSQLMIRE